MKSINQRAAFVFTLSAFPLAYAIGYVWLFIKLGFECGAEDAHSGAKAMVRAKEERDAARRAQQPTQQYPAHN